MPASAWTFYVNVEGIDAAIERLTTHGGTVQMGPQEVPGGSWIVQATDPQGVPFALVAPRR
jgi:Predicted enzyme related to lactoylglutathione lyase